MSSTTKIDFWIDEILTYVDRMEFLGEADRDWDDGLCDSRYMDSVQEFEEALLF